jgi:hypothetical protein
MVLRIRTVFFELIIRDRDVKLSKHFQISFSFLTFSMGRTLVFLNNEQKLEITYTRYTKLNHVIYETSKYGYNFFSMLDQGPYSTGTLYYEDGSALSGP